MSCIRIRCLNPACRLELSRETGVFQYYFCSDSCFAESTESASAPLKILRDGVPKTGFKAYLGHLKEGQRPVYPYVEFSIKKPPVKKLIFAAGCAPVH